MIYDVLWPQALVQVHSSWGEHVDSTDMTRLHKESWPEMTTLQLATVCVHTISCDSHDYTLLYMCIFSNHLPPFLQQSCSYTVLLFSQLLFFNFPCSCLPLSMVYSFHFGLQYLSSPKQLLWLIMFIVTIMYGIA